MNSDDQPPTGTPRIARLSKEDAAAVDRLFEEGFEADGTPGGDSREEAVSNLLGLLDSYPVEPASEDLVNATLARVAREETARADRMSIQNVPRIPRRSVRLPDFFAVAAALFLAVGIGWPLYSVIQDQNQILESQNRLGRLGSAMAGFAADNDGMLPLHDSYVEGECPREGHSRHIDVLAQGEYAEPRYLFIEHDDRVERLVAFRVPFSLETFRMNAHLPDEFLMSDPNPVLEAQRQGRAPVDPDVGSHLHDFEVIVVINFGMATETLKTGRLEDGDSIWVGHDYSPDRPTDPLRPANVRDEILAH